MKLLSGILFLGIIIWLGSNYYPWPVPYRDMAFGDRFMAKSLSVKPPIDYYTEIKFWAEKSGQILAGIGTIGTLIIQWKRRKK